MAKQLMFYSPEDDAIRVTLADGRTAIVTDTPRPLHPAFNKAAIRAGCLTTAMPSADKLRAPSVPAADDAFARRALIKDKMKEAARAPEGDDGYDEAFTGAGIPNIKWLSTALGFQVERPERDELWAEASAELDHDEEEEEEGGDGAGANGDVE